MSISKEGLLITLLVIVAVTGLFGSNINDGWYTDGVPQGGDFSIKNSLDFMFDMVTFNIDGVTPVLSTIFLIISCLVGYLLISTALTGGVAGLVFVGVLGIATLIGGIAG